MVDGAGGEGKGTGTCREYRVGHTSMTNTNPSRFFISSTRYLQTESEKSQVEEERQTYKKKRDPENELERGTESRKGV